MKLFIGLLICFLLGNQTSFAQSDVFLIAKNKSRSVYYSQNEAVKVVYNNNAANTEFRGRIKEIKESSIILNGFNRKTEPVEIPITELTSIRKLNRTGKIITGVIGSIGFILGVALIADDASVRGEFLDGLGTALGTTMIVTTSLPYVLVAATPGKHATTKGFQFIVAKRKSQ